MAQLVGLINGTSNINKDYHFSKPVSSILTSGVVSGLVATQAGGAGTNISVPAGEAVVSVTRTSTTPNETFLVLFQNTATVTLTAGNNKKIFIEITPDNVNDAALNVNSTGSGIGEIKIADNYPASNFLPLGTTNGSALLSTTDKQDIAYNTTIINQTDLTTLTGDIETTGDITASDMVADTFTGEHIGDGSGLTNVTSQTPTTRSTFTAGENITAGDALYVSGTSVYKTDASNSAKINFIGFATNTATTGNNVIVDTSGVSATQSGLTAGSDYFLTNTAGAIGTTAGTNVVSVGKAASVTGIEILNSGKYIRDNYGNRIMTASATLLAASNSEVSTTSGVYVLLKRITVGITGTYRVIHELQAFNTGGNTSNSRIYKNGVASGTYTSYSEDISFVNGDTIEIYGKTGAGECRVRNFSINGTVTYRSDYVVNI